MSTATKLIIGLGNPDPEYKNTYHNVGYLFIDYLHVSISGHRKTDGLAMSQNLKSDVYMNESGNFVLKELKKNNVKPDELFIVHDDSDLTLGSYKLQFGRGAAGHHGIESVQAALKTQNFWRLRIGIRPQSEEIRQKAEKFVLKKISKTDMALLEKTFSEIAEKLK